MIVPPILITLLTIAGIVSGSILGTFLYNYLRSKDE